MALSDLIGKKGRFDAVSKMERVRSKLASEIVRMVIIVTVLGGVAYGLSSWESAREQAGNKARGEANNMAAQVNTLQQKLTRAEKSLPTYQKLKQATGKPEIPLDRRRAKEFLDRLSEAYVFSTLRITMPPVRELDNSYKNTNAGALACDITFNFEGLSDEHLFAFLGDMRKKFSGLIKVTNLSMTRTGSPDAQTLRNIAQTGKVSLVKGDVKLQWFGMKLLKEPPSADTPKATPAGDSP